MHKFVIKIYRSIGLSRFTDCPTTETQVEKTLKGFCSGNIARQTRPFWAKVGSLQTRLSPTFREPSANDIILGNFPCIIYSDVCDLDIVVISRVFDGAELLGFHPRNSFIQETEPSPVALPWLTHKDFHDFPRNDGNPKCFFIQMISSMAFIPFY